MLARLVTCAALLALLGACGDSDECSTDADCPGNSVCSFNVCTIASGEDAQIIVDVNLPCEAALAGDLVLNEILADPAGMDVNGDNVADSGGDEFIEVVNVSDREIGIANVLVQIVTSKTKQVQLGLECLPPGTARVLFGAEKSLGLVNSGATVSLLVSGQIVQTHTYGGEAGQDVAITLSEQLNPDSEWVRHTEVGSESWSPGTCANGNPFPDCAGDTPEPDVIDACGEAPDAGELVINEVKAQGDEFVEIVNRDLRPFAMDGLTVHDAIGQKFAFPDDLCLEPGEAVVLIDGYDPDNPDNPVTMMVPDGVLAFDASLGLNDGGDTVSLLDGNMLVLDEMMYGSGTGISSPDGESMTRAIQLDPASSWVPHSAAPFADGAVTSVGTCPDGTAFPDCPIAGATDATDGGTTVDVPVGDGDTTTDVGPSCGTLVTGPGMLVINEVLVDHGGLNVNCDETINYAQDEFVEIVNITNAPLDLNGVEVWTGHGDELDLVHEFNGAWCLEPKQGVVLFGGGEPAICEEQSTVMTTNLMKLSLNNDSGHLVRLMTVGGVEADSMVYPSAPAGVSWVRYPEGTGEFVLHEEHGSCQPMDSQPYCDLGVPPCLANCALEFSPGACLDGSPLPFCL